jgi:RNA polymerase sigma-70 factor (ECF subfamily)
MSDTISADTRIETFAYELASRRIASIPQSHNTDGRFKRPRRLTDDQREVLILRIAVGLTAEMTASTLRTTRSRVLLVQHQALRAWTVSERS